MIQIDQVSFGYTGEQNTLQDFSLSIKPGECILLCGESGCGKTTVTKLINGLIPHFTENSVLTGRVLVDEQKVADAELYELAKHIGSVFQNPKSQFFNLDTDSELAFGLENEGVPPEQIKSRLQTIVKELKIRNLLNRNIFSLSGGEKQILAFASVYAMNPAVFVLDEPTANLDDEAIERLRDQIGLLKEQGHTVIIAEHRLYFLKKLIDRAVYIKDGRLIQSFTRAEFFGISENERLRMGLRSLGPTELHLPLVGKETENSGVTVENLTCGYKKGQPVFENLSFSILSGQVLAVTGVNGIGKTTLTRCLCGLLKEQSGWIMIDGRKVNAKERRKKSFLVMQDVNHQLFYDSIWNECKQVAGEDCAKIEHVLKSFDLLELREQHPMSLSGGQKQRLAVATAMLSDRRLLIFDEPTSGLDQRHMREVSLIMRKLAEQGHMIMVVSHDKEFMQETCDKVLRLEK